MNVVVQAVCMGIWGVRERGRGNQGGSPLVEVVVVDDDKKQHLAAIKMKNFAHTADHTSWTGFYSRIK